MIKEKTVYKNSLLFLIVLFLLSACGLGATPTPDVGATATLLSLQQTMTALNSTVQAYSAAQTESARATVTPSPTETLTPTATVTPGPLVIQDDFSVDTGRWKECGQCRIENGELHMGPYPVSDKGEGYLAICSDCGLVKDYKMGVDAKFVNGFTDRGFGLLVKESNGDFIDVEITTWQVYGAWVYRKSLNSWGSVLSGDPWKLSGSLFPSYGTNHLEVEVASKGDTSTLTIRINGQLINTGQMPSTLGRVGLVVGLHSLEAVFDNFYFEGSPVSK